MNPLSQLADIQTPDQVDIWPLAIGYWIAIALSLAVLGGLIFWILRRRQRFAIQRASLVLISNIDVSDEEAPIHIHHILKNAISGYFPSLDVKQMHGHHWQNMLLKLYPQKAKPEPCNSIIDIAKWQYDQRTKLNEAQTLKVHAQIWLKASLPPRRGLKDV